MDLLQLRYFYESALSENFAKTAARHMVPASSVSASIKRLEREIGCPLFDRTSNRITLNDSGKKFMHSLSIVFGELDRVTVSLSSPNVGDTREIDVAICALRLNITQSIIEYQAAHPEISFKTHIGSIDDAIAYDIIIDEKNKTYEGFDSFDLCTAQIVLKVAANHPLHGQKLSMYQLRNQPFLSTESDGNLHRIMMSNCKKAGFVPNIIAESNDNLCYRRFIEAGLGIGIGRKVRPSTKTPTIVNLDIVDFNEVQTISCYFKKNTDYGNVKNFLSFLKSTDFQSKFL